jgi:TonB family protein
VNAALKPYLARSFGLHLFIVVGFLYFVARPAAHVDKVYTIDFVGGTTATIASAGTSAAASKAAPAPSEIAAQADPDAIAVKGKRHGPIALPRPSLLRGGGKEADAGAATSGSLAGPGANLPAAAASGSAGSGAGASSGAGVSTDLPNFPYQWYITRMRVMLWQAWQQRMPRVDAEGDVVFSILPNGSFTDLEVESSSGDRDFDKAALDSVQAAAPFPALPSDFHEPFLKIHLKLKSEEAWR